MNAVVYACLFRGADREGIIKMGLRVDKWSAAPAFISCIVRVFTPSRVAPARRSVAQRSTTQRLRFTCLYCNLMLFMCELIYDFPDWDNSHNNPLQFYNNKSCKLGPFIPDYSFSKMSLLKYFFISVDNFIFMNILLELPGVGWVEICDAQLVRTTHTH